MSINVADANIENLVKSTGLDEFQLAELINAKADEGWTNEEITDFLINEMSTENQAAKDEVYAMLGTHEPTWKDYYKLETKKKDPSLLQRLGMWLDENKAADEQRNANARAAIADSWNNWRDNTDPQYRVSLVNAMFGDTAPLHAYYQQQNAANEAAKNREAQHEYNLMFKQLEEANRRKTQMAEEAKINAAERKEAIDTADNLEAEIMDKSEYGEDFSGITAVQKDKFKKAIEKVAEKGGDTSKYEVVAKALGLLETESDEDEDEAGETPVVEEPKDKPKVNLGALKTESANISAIKPTDVSWDNRNAVVAYNKKAKEFNDKLNKLGVSSTNMPRLSLITPPVNPATPKFRDKSIEDALQKLEEEKLKAKAAAAIASNTKRSSLAADVKAEVLKTHKWTGSKWEKKN